MDYDDVPRAQGFSPVKVFSKFDFFDTVKVGKRDRRGHVVDIFRSSLTNIEQADEWISNYSLATHTRWNRLYATPKKQ